MDDARTGPVEVRCRPARVCATRMASSSTLPGFATTSASASASVSDSGSDSGAAAASCAGRPGRDERRERRPAPWGTSTPSSVS